MKMILYVKLFYLNIKVIKKTSFFNNMIRFDIDLGNPDEKIQELLDVVKDEYQVLLREAKLKRILK